MGVPVGERAVVLGASMTGLLAARVLVDSYSTVTVVERDELAEGSGHRRGVPQGRQLHRVLARGQQVLEKLFPGLTEAMVDDGVPVGDVLGDSSVTLSGHRFRRLRTGLVVLSASRPLLEHHVRARVRTCAGVTFRGSTDVVGLAGSRDSRHVTGSG